MFNKIRSTRHKKIPASRAKSSFFTLTSRNYLLMLMCQLLNLLTLSLELSWWMLAIIALCLLWHMAIYKKLTQQPSKLFVGVLSVTACILLVLTSQMLGLLLTMLHLLCISYVLKSFELKKRSDFYQIVLLGLFVVVSSLIFEQSLYFAIVVTLIIIINFVLLLGCFSQSTQIKAQLKSVSKIVIQSVPLAVFLFFVFPKLSPLWAVPTAKSAKTGLSDSVKVGDIANLALSDELAFRVKFSNNQLPAYAQMYWRTIVMENFDGKSWTTNRQIKRNLKTNSLNNIISQYPFDETIAKGKQLNYQVIASPTYQHWLYGLDLARVDGQDNTIVHREDYSLFSIKPLTQNTSYNITSYTEMPLALNITNLSYQLNISVPEGSNPLLVKKAKKLRQQFENTAKGNRALIQAVLNTFNQDTYRYTLNPPVLQGNSLDQFYFETKAGFCEHFASSFTFLMRAAGIPARLVTGYMGGEYNSGAGYYSIYQRDAHAWSEVWLKNKGWVRIDPTAAINPERVERGFSEQLLREQAEGSNDVFSLLRFSNNNALINSIRMQLEALDYNWTRWVIGYTADKQNNFLRNIVSKMMLLKDIKFKTLVKYGFGLVCVVLLLWGFNRVLVARKPHTSCYYYQQILVMLAKHGIQKPVDMTPADFVFLVKKAQPEIAIEFAKFSQLYSSIQYQPLNEKQQESVGKALVQSYQKLKKF